MVTVIDVTTWAVESAFITYIIAFTSYIISLFYQPNLEMYSHGKKVKALY